MLHCLHTYQLHPCIYNSNHNRKRERFQTKFQTVSGTNSDGRKDYVPTSYIIPCMNWTGSNNDFKVRERNAYDDIVYETTNDRHKEHVPIRSTSPTPNMKVSDTKLDGKNICNHTDSLKKSWDSLSLFAKSNLGRIGSNSNQPVMQRDVVDQRVSNKPVTIQAEVFNIPELPSGQVNIMYSHSV